jgi:hypothetical protein
VEPDTIFGEAHKLTVDDVPKVLLQCVNPILAIQKPATTSKHLHVGTAIAEKALVKVGEPTCEHRHIALR